ncbi:hypothetical protein OHB54_32260 [Streptomyces sp. NBC_01007]|nr:hypothetical protein OHB54_32260 [Streptomyces sp. NBC_01007]
MKGAPAEPADAPFCALHARRFDAVAGLTGIGLVPRFVVAPIERAG